MIKSNSHIQSKAEEYLDSRLRYLYKEWYDSKKSLMDADFVWWIKETLFPAHSLV